jgi:hypothetical protein
MYVDNATARRRDRQLSKIYNITQRQRKFDENITERV